MTGYKPDFNRFKKVLLRDGEPDILPFCDFYVNDETIVDFTGKRPDISGRVNFYYEFGYDFVQVYPNITYPVKENVDLLEHGDVEIQFLNNNHGIIENRQDFDKYCWPVVDETVTYNISEAAKILPDGMKLVLDGNMGILETVTALMGFVPLSFAIKEDEQLVWDIFEKVGEIYLDMKKRCLESEYRDSIGAITMGDDLGFSHSTMLSPDDLRKFVFPWQKKVVDLVHSYDLPFIFHSCGMLDEIMDDLIDYVGIDAKHSYEEKIIPVTEAKKKYSDRIAILGGVDMHILCTAKEHELREYVRNIIRTCAPGGGYAFGTGNSVPNYIPIENYRIMLDEGRKNGIYPIK